MSDYERVSDEILRKRLTFVLEHFVTDDSRNLSGREVARCIPVLVWAVTAPFSDEELDDAHAPVSAVAGGPTVREEEQP